MLSFEVPAFRQAVEETAAWCALKLKGAPLVDAKVVTQRRVADREFSQLMNNAREKANRRWFPAELTRTKEWHRAHVLLGRIREALSPMRLSFRSAALKPEFDFDTSQTIEAWAGAVTQTTAKRSSCLSRTALGEDAGWVNRGRLLLYSPEENLACGGAEVRSHGFFDVNNVPPWDLRVAFSERTLVSWVPAHVIEAAQPGIDANPEACIRWAD
jgi:hypothetical protein